MQTQNTARVLIAMVNLVILLAASILLQSSNAHAQISTEAADTRELVALVKDASELVRTRGEAAFSEFRTAGTRWRRGEQYIFVLDTQGNMLVHLDPGMEGKNQLNLKDINSKPIIRGLISAVTTVPTKPEGWYHYEWTVPGGILPRWKSSYAQFVKAPSGKSYVVGSGVYNDRMEKVFVEDMVNDAIAEIERNGEKAFQLFRDPTGRFIAKDAYIFVYDMNGTNLVLPAFPNLENRNLSGFKDTQGKPVIREMIDQVQTRGAGWIDYMWPKPGESVSTQKTSYVSQAKLGDKRVMVGAGVYLADAPKTDRVAKTTAPDLIKLVREGAAVLEKQGENAYPDFRKKGSKWFSDDTYFVVWTKDGLRTFHAADPTLEGLDANGAKDILGRPYGEMFLKVAESSAGEGWVHYMYPEPGGLFPTWKSTFLKRVTFPSGKQHLIGSGIYNMQMDRVFIEDVVDRAVALIAQRGKAAFAELRDKKGPFVFMDTYVFVNTPDGTELVNAGQPSLEGRSVIDLKDVKGTPIARNYIAAAMKDGKAWVAYYWYRPGESQPALKQTYVRKVQSGNVTYIVGSGFYVAAEITSSMLRPSKTR
ncbi:MAG TPA: cache domain-containing protein [Pyrinomonadaceae bacterium]|nr:cache domain-containing protein [Pyrinomonadaceae bacterium]